MALKLTLKPHERMIIGGAVISNGKTGSHLIIENNVPILREKDILSKKDAVSPAKRIYYIIQLMYVDENHIEQHHQAYLEFVKQFVEAAPSAVIQLTEISNLILQNKHYQALKLAKKLIDYEREIIHNVR